MPVELRLQCSSPDKAGTGALVGFQRWTDWQCQQSTVCLVTLCLQFSKVTAHLAPGLRLQLRGGFPGAKSGIRASHAS